MRGRMEAPMSVRWPLALLLVVVGMTLLGRPAHLSAQAPTPTVAPCPTGAVLTIIPPQAVTPTTVTVTIDPPVNIKPVSANDPASLHLHYFIDVPATATGAVIPAGDPRVVHSGNTTQNLGTLEVGPHNLTVVLGQFDHTACSTRATLQLNIGQAPAPVASKTADTELANANASAWLVVVLLGGCLLIVLYTRRRFGVRR